MRRAASHHVNELIGMPVGQIVSRMDRVRTTKEVVFDMVEEFIEVSERLHGLTTVSS
jgi:DNA-binding GntR family transcriptional regulator